jgi:prolyl oligopeptidase
MLKKSLRSASVLISFIALSVVTQGFPSFQTCHESSVTGRPSYPVSERTEHFDTYHGVKVTDPYRWLEDMKSEKTHLWIKAQDELTNNQLKAVPERESIRKRISELSNFDLYSIPVKRNGYYFYTRTAAGSSRQILYVRKGQRTQPSLLLDTLSHFKDESLTISGYWPSPDGSKVAYSLTKGQSRWRRLGIIDTENGSEQPDMLSGLNTLGGQISWSSNSLGFYYIKFDSPEEGEELQSIVKNPKIYYHRLGKSQSDDLLVYERPDKQDWLLSHQVSEDGYYLIISVREGGSTKNRIFYQDLRKPRGEIRSLLENADAGYTFLGNRGSKFWFYTDLQASRGRVVAIDVNNSDRENWIEVIPEAKESIAGGSLVGGNAIGLYGNRFVIMYLKDGRPSIKAFNLQGRFLYEVRLPEGGSLWGGFSGLQQEGELFYRFLRLTSPGTTYRLDLRTGHSSIFQKSELNFDQDQIVTKQVFYKSKDGTVVPMFVSFKKGIRLDGSNRAFMYAYGAFGWTSFLFYQPHVIAWLEMGGIYAQPGIRGGGEYGEEWHRAGMKTNEQNSIDDFVSAAEWLIEKGYTSPSKLVVNGGSASGSMDGAALLQRPDLFAASIIDRPVLDMLRYNKFTAARSWIQEFGSPENQEEFKALFAYSPYHNIKQGQCYPPTLVMVGERDEIAVPMHGYKFTAAMQYAQGCDRPVLLKVMWGAGHTFGATPEQTIDSFTDMLTFCLKALK